MFRILTALSVVLASSSVFAASLQFRCQMHDAPYLQAQFNIYSSIEGTQIPGYPGYGNLSTAERAILTENVRSTCANWARAAINSYSTSVYAIGYAVVVSGGGYLFAHNGQEAFNIASSGEYIFKTSAPSIRVIPDCGVRRPGRPTVACQ